MQNWQSPHSRKKQISDNKTPSNEDLALIAIVQKLARECAEKTFADMIQSEAYDDEERPTP